MRKTDREAGRHVGELASEFGLNPRTIRYYERIGLLAASTRTAAGYRIYGPADRDRLRFILKAKTVGLSLNEIRDILALRRQGVSPCTHVLAVLEDKLRQLDQHIRALAEFRDELAAVRAAAVATPPLDEGCVCGVIEHHDPCAGHHSPRDAGPRPSSRATDIAPP